MAVLWETCPHCQVFFCRPEHTPAPPHCPACAKPLTQVAPQPHEPEWHYIQNKQKIGPVSQACLQDLARAGTLHSGDMVLAAGSTRWVAASTIEGLFPAPAPPSAMMAEVPSADTIAAAPAVPPVSRPIPEWYYIRDKQKIGPVGWPQIRELAATSQLHATDLVLETGTAKWVPASSLDDSLFPLVEAAVPMAVAEPEPAAPPDDMAGMHSSPYLARAMPEWYYIRDKQKVGPVRFPQIRDLAAAGQLRRTDLVLESGTAKWVPASTIDESLFPPEESAPPAQTVELPDEASAAAPSAAEFADPVPEAIWPSETETEPDREPLLSPAPAWCDVPFAVAVEEDAPMDEPAPAPQVLELTEHPLLLPPLAHAVDVEPAPADVTASPTAAAPAPAQALPSVELTTPIAPSPEVTTTVPASAETSSTIEPASRERERPEGPSGASSGRSRSQLDSVSADEIVQRFESAWLQGRRPELDDFLPADPELYRTVLTPLVRIDLRCRLNCNEPIRVEHYRDHYPELAGDSAALVDLLALEFAQRRRLEHDLSPAEYQQRFPQCADAIAARLVELMPSTGSQAPTVPQEPAARTDFPAVPGHQILEVLGREGTDVVYKARHIKLNRLVALQLSQADEHARPDQRQRFLVDGQAVARLHHPNIVEMYEIGEYEGRPFFSLELVDGGSLAKLLDGTPRPPRPCAELVEKLADAVHYAHSQGVIHRNLTPANILTVSSGVVSGELSTSTPHHSPLTTHQAKITNFGLTKQIDAGSAQTPGGPSMGTPNYLAPEQVSGPTSAVGPATDVYALGAILYEMLTGRPPFRGASVADTLEQVRIQEPVPPSSLQGKVPRDLDTICLKCLHKEPARRYANAEELAADLRRFLASKPIHARSEGFVERVVKFGRREPVAASLLAAVVVAGVLAFLTMYVKYAGAGKQQALADLRAGQAEARADAARLDQERAEQRAESARVDREKADQRALAVELAREQAEKRAAQASIEKAQADREAATARANEKKTRDERDDAVQQALRTERARLLTRHQQQADDAEKAQQWAAAAFHLGNLIDAHPKDEKLVVRRADAYRRLGQWLPAAVDYARALELKPDLPLQEARDRCLARAAPVRAVSAIGLAADTPLPLLPALQYPSRD